MGISNAHIGNLFVIVYNQMCQVHHSYHSIRLFAATRDLLIERLSVSRKYNNAA